MTELELIVLLAETARELAAPDAPPDALAAAAARVSERSGLDIDLQRLADPRPQDVSELSAAEAAFLDALGSIAALAASREVQATSCSTRRGSSTSWTGLP